MTDAVSHLSTIEKILIIKLRAVGDVVLSTIVTKNLRLAFPSAVIHYLTEPPGREVVHLNPFIDDVLVFDRETMSSAGLIRAVRRRRYDLVIDLFGNPRTALVTWLSRAPVRVGYRFRGRSYAYNVIAEPRGGHVHNTEFNLDALRALGIDIPDRNIYFQFSRADRHFVDGFLTEAGLGTRGLACMNPGGGWYTKRWGIEQFAALGDRIVESRGMDVVLAWGPGEEDDALRIKGLMRYDAFVPPPTTLGQLGALLKRCKLLVTNDSGPMHIAAALGTPVLAIFGPTNPQLQGPFGPNHALVRKEGLECLGCNLTSCPIGHPCMKTLTVDEVADKFDELIERNIGRT